MSNEKTKEAFMSHRDTKRLPSSDFEKVWLYLDELFPDYKELIRKTEIYKNSNCAMACKIGLDGVAGLYMPQFNSVFVMYSKFFSEDEIVLHEMLHFLSKAFGSSMVAASSEEIFAYKKSVDYLRRNGRSEEFIVERYLMPFFMEMELRKGKPYNAACRDAEVEAKCMLSEEFMLESRKEEEDGDDITSRFEGLA